MLPFLFGALSGALGGLFGVGGGILLVPLLVNFLHRTQHEAQGASLAFFIVTAFVAVVPYVRADAIPWTLVGVLAIGAVPGVVLGASWAKRIPGRALRVVFGVAILATAVRLLVSPPEAAGAATWPLAANLLLGLGVGITAGLLGIGGGTLLVPALVLGEGVGQHAAQGASLALIVPVGLVGALSYRRYGHSAGRFLPALFAGGAFGGWLGASEAHRLQGALLSRLFALLLVAVAARMIVGRPGPGGSGGEGQAGEGSPSPSSNGGFR